MRALTCFKAYDIRGRWGDELEDIANRIGRSYAQQWVKQYPSAFIKNSG